MSLLYSQTDSDFAVSMNENDWIFDENKLLKSVSCIQGGKWSYTPVIWDNEGAYVQHNDEKIYILDNIH